jgi:hypothetical protein
MAAYLLRVSSQILSGIMGGMSLVCLYYAGQVPDYKAALALLGNALVFGGIAAAIVYCKHRYLD